MVVRPSGDFLHATCNPGDMVERISVNSTTGALTSTRYSVGTAGSHLQLTWSSTGKHLQKAFNEPDGSVDIYSVDLDGSVALAASYTLGAGFTKLFAFRAP